MKIAVIGAGISGLSAAWALSARHDVSLIEAENRWGGHANTVDVTLGGKTISVDTGFIVYNPPAYPNLTALFDHLDVKTAPSNMTFSVSLDNGAYEYSGSGLHRLFGQRANLLSPAQWRLTWDIVRFFRHGRSQADGLDDSATLGDLLDRHEYSESFINRHLLPMAGAIWSAAPGEMKAYPARAFLQFFENHGLLKLTNRPAWRTVEGGSRQYVEKLLAASRLRQHLRTRIKGVKRSPSSVRIWGDSYSATFDHVVIATHADQALAMLTDADELEAADLGAFSYSSNRAVLHTDERLMPTRKGLWASWNYLGQNGGKTALTYWMNSLQPLPVSQNIFVTLNPIQGPRPEAVLGEFSYEHPVFDCHAMAAQQRLWRHQGRRRTWFCGAHFGAGFHEDGLQAGLAVAEELGGVRRPWMVPDESSRIFIAPKVAERPVAIREAAE